MCVLKASFLKTSAPLFWFHSNFYLTILLSKQLYLYLCLPLSPLLQLHYQGVFIPVVWHFFIEEGSSIKMKITTKIFQNKCPLSIILMNTVFDSHQFSLFQSKYLPISFHPFQFSEKSGNNNTSSISCDSLISFPLNCQNSQQRSCCLKIVMKARWHRLMASYHWEYTPFYSTMLIH